MEVLRNGLEMVTPLRNRKFFVRAIVGQDADWTPLLRWRAAIRIPPVHEFFFAPWHFGFAIDYLCKAETVFAVVTAEMQNTFDLKT
jgi:hypothetical protein